MDSNLSAGKYLTFTLKSQIYGVPISCVREINRLTEITPVPQTAVYVAGVMNLRGKVISVVDLRLKFRLEVGARTKQSCIIVVESSDDQVGMIVDSVNGVVDLLPAHLEPNPSINQSENGYVSGIGKLDGQVVVLLDILKCLSGEIHEAAA